MDTLTNLLPEDAARAARSGYFLRLATVAFIALSILMVIHGLLLLPTYAYLAQESNARATYLAELDQSLVAGGDKQASDRLAAVRSNAAYLGHLAAAPSVSGALRLLLAVPHPGIRLTGFSYGPVPGGTAHRMLLSGAADTREALRNYDLALSSVPWIATTDLPISAYAKEQDISFDITLTGTFTAP